MAPTARSTAARRREASRRATELTQERALDPDWDPTAYDEDELEDISRLEGDASGELDRRVKEAHLPASSLGRDAPSDDAQGARGRDVGMIVKSDADLVPNGCPMAILGKRTHLDEDLTHPEAPPPAPRGQSTTTMWRNANNMTKKSRAMNMQKSIADIFASRTKEPKRPHIDLSQSVYVAPPCDPNTRDGEHEHPPTGSMTVQDPPSCEDARASPATAISFPACTSPAPELSPPACAEPEAMQVMEDVVGVELDISPADTSLGGGLEDAASVTSDSEDEEGEGEAENEEEATNEAARTLTLNEKLRLLRRKLVRNDSPRLSLDKLVRELERVQVLEQYSKKLDERQQARDQAFEHARQASQGALRHRMRKRANKIRPAAEASAHVASGRDHGVYFARQLRAAAEHVRRTGELPENRQGKGAAHATNFDNPEVKKDLKRWANREIAESEGGLGKNRPTPDRLLNFVNAHLFPRLGIDATISMTTAVRWLKWLGFYCARHTKGIYWV